jgi:hypothetical protein
MPPAHLLPELHPDVVAALGIGTTTPIPQDETQSFHQKDRPALFGDDIIDCAHGLLNLAKNAKTLMGCPTIPKIDAPAIAIGGGPSLDTHLDAIRKLQNKCLIVCSQIPGLFRQQHRHHRRQRGRLFCLEEQGLPRWA